MGDRKIEVEASITFEVPVKSKGWDSHDEASIRVEELLTEFAKNPHIKVTGFGIEGTQEN